MSHGLPVPQGAQDLLDRISSLNLELVKRNRQLESLKNELRTFTSIAANDYKETLRKLYTGMEYIINNDAKNLSNEGKANVRRAQSAIQKLKLLTEDIVSYSSLQNHATQPERVDLNEILSGVTKDLEKSLSEFQLRVESDNLPIVNGYPHLISVLFNHLLDNAIKFRKEESGGEIYITVKNKTGSLVSHPAALPGIKYAIISFSDNGVGFESDNAEHIFIIFSKLHEKGKYKGSGVGLAICKKIMEMHEGFITGEGIPGDGAVFSCYFPLGD
ncbi:MAG TPA: ATP-binding protein [Chryseolinea sp.]|nr:ATP-binding protein [Chryseolinea sp.]